MRRKWLLGFGFALASGSAVGPVVAQPPGVPASPFGTLKTGPAAPAPLGGFSPAAPTAPAAPGAYVPPPSALPSMPAAAQPVGEIEIPSVLGNDHPWRLKADHGAYFILVKSYVRPAKGSRSADLDKGPTARELAEGLATEIRDKYKVQAFLFEYISEERKAEERARQEARRKAQAYLNQIEEARKQAALKGLDFIEPDARIRVFTHDHKDQIGVLVGPFQTEDAAVKALPQVKAWETPKNEALCDKASIVVPDANNKPVLKHAAVSPYKGAFVVANPAAPKAQAVYRGLDPFVVKLNEGRPYSLLKTTKSWTLGVKAFSSPVQMVSADDKKPTQSKPVDVLFAGAADAEKMAGVLRAMKDAHGNSLGLDAYVLHTRTSSLVTIGQFDGPNDPELIALQRKLGAFKVKVSEDELGTRPVMNAPGLFEKMMPMPIPRAEK
jgi:hypothetical protein